MPLSPSEAEKCVSNSVFDPVPFLSGSDHFMFEVVKKYLTKNVLQCLNLNIQTSS